MEQKNLTEQELDIVSGGGYEKTCMKCTNCGYESDWYGNKMDEVRKCPNCGVSGAFKGYKYYPNFEDVPGFVPPPPCGC